MNDIFDLRLVCSRIADNIPPQFLGKLWKKKKSELEATLVRNRLDLFNGIQKAEIQTNVITSSIRLNGNIEPLFTALKENYQLSKRLQAINGDYDDAKLSNQGKGFKEQKMQNLKKILGENFWQFTKPKTTETILLVPKQIGHDYWCENCVKLHSYIIVDMIFFNINEGIRETLIDNEEWAYPETRLMPIFGGAYTLRKMMSVLDLYEGGSHELMSLHLPKLRCGNKSSTPSGGL